ncbi:MAG: hypothetical protein HY694_18620 [Deltaproteobacteria bacterium]|nr:hypothetical protein [Deltaproteobacteria bacterium]
MTLLGALSGLNEAPEVAGRRTIPFDYAFRYDLTGKPGNVINKTVTVSIEAAFVAVSVGYGVVPKVTRITFGPKLPSTPPAAPPLSINISGLFLTHFFTAAPQKPRLRDIPLGVILDSLDPRLPETSRLLKRETGPEAVFKSGIRLNPDVAEKVLQNGANVPLDSSLLENLFQVVAAPPENIQFLYAIFDEGSGREFQSDPILNIAGLGISNGDRPFRYFAQPITFAPQSTIRMEVREVSDFQGELHVSLQGYKALGGAGTPTGKIFRRVRRIRRR